MSTAVLLATRAQPGDLCARLVGQLAASGFEHVVVLARPEWAAERGPRPATSAGSLVVVESADTAADLAALATLCRGADPRSGVVLLDANLVAHDSVISAALAGPGDAVTALVSPLEPAPARPGPAGAGPDQAAPDQAAPIRVERGRVISAGSALHRVDQPTGRFAGLIRVAAPSAPAAAGALGAAGAVLTGRSSAAADSLALALVAMVRAGLAVRARQTAPLFCAPVSGPEAVASARSALAAVSGQAEDAVRMRLAVKSDDDLFATFAVSSWSPVLVRLAARLGLSPTSVTWISVGLAVLAAVSFAEGGRVTAIAGAVLLYLSFVLDCVDGQLARYTHRFGRFGGWLDALADRGKEYLVYAGLAVGAAQTGTADVWPLAIAAMALQTVRHMTDCWYGVARDQAVARLAPARFEFAGDPSATAGSGSAGKGPARPGVVETLVRATNSGRRSALHWVKKTVVFPIGERWVVIAAGAAILNPRTVFWALLSLGGLSALYTVAVRVLRARSLRAPALSTVDVAEHRDDGPLARTLGRLVRRLGVRVPPLASAGLAAAAGVGALVAAARGDGSVGWLLVAAACLVIAALAGRSPHDGALDWYVPALLRLAEVSVVIGLAVRYGVALPLVFALLGVFALVYYDLAARLEKSASPVRARALLLGWDGRLLVLGAAAAAGLAEAGFAGLAAYLVAAFVGAAAWGAARAHTRAPAAGARPPRQRPDPAAATAGSAAAAETSRS